MPTHLKVSDEKLKKLVQAFEDLQDKYRSLGARDTEPDWHFQNVIRCAIQGRAVNFATLDFELYRETGWRAANTAMVKAAGRIYTHIRGMGRIADVEGLKRYCDRLNF